MEKLHRKVEFASNIIIIILAIALLSALVKVYFFSKPVQGFSDYSKNFVGKQINLSGVNWSTNSKTVLLAISSKCGYCTSSLPFYKKLSETISNSQSKLIVVFPEADTDGPKLLEENGVKAHKTINVDFKTINVTGTPTMFYLDASGLVTEAKIGKLTDLEETAFLQKISTN